MQFGGCAGADTCQLEPFPGAVFQYLAANVTYEATGETVLPAYEIRKIDNAKIAFIGLTLEATPTIVTPVGRRRAEVPSRGRDDERARPEAPERGGRPRVRRPPAPGRLPEPAVAGAVHRAAESGRVRRREPLRELRWHRRSRRSPSGLSSTGRRDRQRPHARAVHLPELRGHRQDAHERLVVRSRGHRHRPGDRSPVEGREVGHRQERHRHADVARDPDAKAIVDRYRTASAPIANQIVGAMTADMTRTSAGGNAPTGESALGDVIADAQLKATEAEDFGDSVIAFMNPGGIRADLLHATSPGGEAAGLVTYGELFTVQPFGNSLVVKTCTGTQIDALLEQQIFPRGHVDVPDPAGLERLHVLVERWRAPAGSRIDPASIKLNGTTLGPTTGYRVTMNSFLASGGDGFTVFNQCTNALGGEIDLDALVRYFQQFGDGEPATGARSAGPAEPHHAAAVAASEPDLAGDSRRESPAILRDSDEQQRTRDADPGRGRCLDDRPRRGADPRLRGHLPHDQRGRGRPRNGGSRRQGRGARRHRLQVRGRHPRRRAVDPPERQPGRRGLRRRRDRRARHDEGGRRGASAPLEEARPLRARLEGDRGCRRERRARQRQGDRGRQGRPDPRPRRPWLPPGVARRHPPRPGPRRVPRARSSAAR